jgi:LytS/YehU family sensor histidine kinase
MRYHKTIDIRFEVEVEDRSINIMPLLFIIMVENAFKHGVEKLRKDAYVHLRLAATPRLVDFEIENNLDPEETAGTQGLACRTLENDWNWCIRIGTSSK